MARSRADALFVSDYGENFTHRKIIAELAAEHKMPTIHPYQGFVDVGGLMEYAIDFGDLYREVAALVTRVVKGESPAHIPFRQATKFALRLNATAAKKINVEFPPSLLLRADEVIE
jgi:putative ABC transport system substrate-binding protein